MKKKNKETTTYETKLWDVGFIDLLQLMFIGLKLGGVITWSWWLVMAPYLILTMLTMMALLVIVGAMMITRLKNDKTKN